MTTPHNEPSDELLERYADAVAQDPRRPSERVRAAARAHAQMLRDQAAAAQRVESVASIKPAANHTQWKLSLIASLAVVGLAGLLFVQIDRGAPQERELALASGEVAAPAPPSEAPSAKAEVANVANPKTDSEAAPAPVAQAKASPSPSPPSPPPPSALRSARESPTTNAATAQLLVAVQTGRVETVQKLLSDGISINSRLDNGNTALMVAVIHQQAQVVRLLLSLGADTSLVNQQGLTALQIAKQMGFADMARLLATPPP